ncbi:MAG: VF530 family protein [Gordonibacter sp.]|uniref:VF530 family protein n=1 Tax=Gordonibacter sp. TaxID=1968902 RepID=UPI002FCAF7CC
MATEEPIAPQRPKDPLHGITLEMMLVRLVDKYGWDDLAQRIHINCFKNDPSIKSSLSFLRKTPWARNKVEKLYKGTTFLREEPPEPSL